MAYSTNNIKGTFDCKFQNIININFNKFISIEGKKEYRNIWCFLGDTE